MSRLWRIGMSRGNDFEKLIWQSIIFVAWFGSNRVLHGSSVSIDCVRERIADISRLYYLPLIRTNYRKGLIC